MRLLWPKRDYKATLDLRHEFTGTLSLPWHESLFNNNVAAASQLWALEFVAWKARVAVIDTTEIGTGTVVGYLESPSRPHQSGWRRHADSIHYIRVGVLANQEVIGAVDDVGNVTIWRTSSVLGAIEGAVAGDAPSGGGNVVKRLRADPWVVEAVSESCWGLAFHPTLPLVAASDNSSSLTLFLLRREPGRLRTSCRTSRTNLGGNIPSIDFVPSISFQTDTVWLSFVTLSVDDTMSGSFGIWEVPLSGLLAKPSGVVGSFLFDKEIQQRGWVIRGLLRSSFLPVPSVVELGACAHTDTSQGGYVDSDDSCHDDDFHLHITRQLGSLGFFEAWTYKQPWVAESLRRSWASHERQPDVPALEDIYLFVTTATQAFLVRAIDGRCEAASSRALLPQVFPYTRFDAMAISIAEVISPLSLIVAVTRLGTVVFFRITMLNDRIGLRQEAVLCTPCLEESSFIVGLSSFPARSEKLEDLGPPNSIPRDLGLSGKYFLRLHYDDQRVENFLLSSTDVRPVA